MIAVCSRLCPDLSCVNLNDCSQPTPMDIHCPDLPGGVNFWKAACLPRTGPRGACVKRDCLVGKQLRAAAGLPPVEIFVQAPEWAREHHKLKERAKRISETRRAYHMAKLAELGGAI